MGRARGEPGEPGSPTELDAELAREEEGLRAAGLWRTLEPPGAGVDFASSDYLGLSRHPEVVEAACRAAREHGAGARAARLLGGGSPEDAQLEREVAGWLGAEAALLFPSGYQANLGVISALIGPGDAVISDQLVHASLVDGCRLSRARVLVHRHADLGDVERCLREARGARRRLVLTEGVFSMDGDAAPLAELLELCAREGALLAVDEAHAAGLLGPAGAGACAAALGRGAEPRALAARVVTGGKALGVAGALVVGSRALVQHLANRARSFVFTTGAPPPVAGALRAAVRLAAGMDAERARVRGLARGLAARLDLPAPAGAIVPLILGDSARALALSERLRSAGLEVRAVRPPAVPEGTARLRIVLHADHRDGDVERLGAALLEARADAVHARRAVRDTAPKLAPAFFVAGTDTGVGKTLVSALLARAAARRGPVRYWKPVQTGPDSDTAEVARLVGDVAGEGAIELVTPLLELPLAASPHEAAAAAGERLELGDVRARLSELRRDSPAVPLIVELAGGLLVPYSERATQADLLAAEHLPVVLVARSGLGTLNHTLLTLEALAARRVPPAALVLSGTPHASNRATLEMRGGVPRLLELPPLELPPDRGAPGAVLESWIDAQADLWALLATLGVR